MTDLHDRFPGYDVLSKRDSMSWNDATRKVMDERLAIKDEPVFFSHEEWLTMQMLCERIIPQPDGRPRIPVAAYIDRRLLHHGSSGTRIEPMPYDGEAWKTALAALDREAHSTHGMAFHKLRPAEADELLKRCQKGDLHDPAWKNVPPKMFFEHRVLRDVTAAYYSHPDSWSEMGFGGPASPRGYVRMAANRRDRWEAAEAYPGKAAQALKDNKNVR